MMMYLTISAQTLDSTSVGNKFRYINHQGDPHANCRAKILLCNTIHRIGMFACQNIDIGDELLFDYGYEYNVNLYIICILIRPQRKLYVTFQSH